MSTFEKFGKTWTRHRPGDLNPAQLYYPRSRRPRKIFVLLRRDENQDSYDNTSTYPSHVSWKRIVSDPSVEVIGWCYDETQKP